MLKLTGDVNVLRRFCLCVRFVHRGLIGGTGTRPLFDQRCDIGVAHILPSDRGRWGWCCPFGDVK